MTLCRFLTAVLASPAWLARPLRSDQRQLARTPIVFPLRCHSDSHLDTEVDSVFNGRKGPRQKRQAAQSETRTG